MPSNAELALHLYVQLAVIIAACYVIGYVLRYLGQTQVVGEMVAGVLLGPSLLGLLWPAAQSWLFPTKLILTSGATSIEIVHPSMVVLYTLGQLGLVLYMFLVGLEFNTSLISKHLRQAGLISVFGIVAPVILGGVLGYNLAGQSGLIGNGIRPWQAAIFLAAAMSVTAFPVLARILTDLGLTRTKVGTLSIGAAATTDAMAWCLLAIVLASISNSLTIAVVAIGGGLAYALFMFLVGRKLLTRFDQVRTYQTGLPFSGLVILVGILLLCAAFTDGVGIHSIFGAFILGVVMPRGQIAEEIRRSIDKLAMVVFVPIFFVYSGLNTHLDLLANPAILVTAIAVVAIAFIAKGGACFLAAWINGSGLRVAASIGVLMNARGLMELVLINIGLDRGIITPSLFTILVLMTIITTMIAAPVFKLFYRGSSNAETEENSASLAAAVVD